jgi:TonB family protein
MKFKSTQRIWCTLFACLTVAMVPRVQANEPQPEMWVTLKDENLPVYTTRSLPPRRTAPPAYPKEERAKKISGEALIYVLVDVKGDPVEATIKRSLPSAAFGEAAQQAVLKWRFQQVKKDGKPTRYLIQTPVVFTIAVD